MTDIIYLDSAATTFQKPQGVYDASDRCLREYCGNAGRGSHKIAMMSAEKIYECRSLLSDMFNTSPENVIFTQNTTYALNMAIQGSVNIGDHILISDLEHNSVLRPVHDLSIHGQASYSVFNTLYNGRYDEDSIMSDIRRKTRNNTRVIICTHTSNICSVTLPISRIGQYCREKGILFIVDAAQGAGHFDIDMEKMNIDILCIPAHKGLYGTQGLGAMLLKAGGHMPKARVFGGSGVNSLSPLMPNDPPEAYEAGTLPTPSIAALCEGIKFVNDMGCDSIREHERMLYSYALDRLDRSKQIRIYRKWDRGSVLLFNILGLSCDAVGEHLANKGICVRTGYHCAALAHKALMTASDGCNGAVRVSFSVFNTRSEIDALCRALSDLE